MTTPTEKTKFSDDTKLADLTVGEFRQMLDDMLQRAIWTIEQTMYDPVDDRLVTPELANYLKKDRETRGAYISLNELEQELDLDDE